MVASGGVGCADMGDVTPTIVGALPLSGRILKCG
jgi:hypothetical protein